MNNFDIREFFFWYGPADLKVDMSLPIPWLNLANILANFKSGRFNQREELFDLCCKNREGKISIFALQLFFLVAREADLILLSKYTQDASDVELKSIALRSTNSLIGIPLAHEISKIIEKISDVKVKKNMTDILESFLTKDNRRQFGYDVKIIDIMNVIDLTLPRDVQFTFCGKPAFLGDIAINMQLLMQVAMSFDTPTILGDSSGPTLLSAASGLECPVSYTTVMTLDKVKLVLDYVKAVSAMGKAMGGWKRGSKYFYGHEIV